MELDEDQAADAFVFLLKSPVKVKGLMCSPVGMRKLILVKMMKVDTCQDDESPVLEC